MNWEVEFTDQAKQDLRDILDYITYDAGTAGRSKTGAADHKRDPLFEPDVHAVSAL